jgi:dipeptidyl-peptidase-4
MRVSVKGFASFDLSDDGALILVSLSGRLYTVRRADGKVSELPAGKSPIVDPRFSPDGKRVAYVRDRDLYVLDLATKKETQLTHSASPRVTNGLAEFVAQEELDRFTGLWWSPDGKQLAYEEADSRPVETFHLVDVTHPENDAEATPYPRPGTPNVKLRLGVIGVAGGKTTFIAWDATKFPYLASVEWKEAKAPLTLVVLTREQRDLEVLAADPKTGKTTRLLAEHDDDWLNLDPSVPRWLPDGSGFLWSSEKTGRRVLELRDRAGGLRTALTGAAEGYEALDDTDGKSAWFSGAPDPTESHLYRVALAGGASERLTREPGVHSAIFGKSHDVYVLRETTATTMPRLTVHTLDKEIGELPSVAETPPFVPGLELTTTGEQKFRVAITRPRSFQRGKKYPVILDVYGGPHHQQVMRAEAPALLRQWMADHGYVVVAIDGRGTPNRGREWERAIRGNFAAVTLDDQVTALRALATKYPELDLARVGTVGWSFGGYLAALSVLKRPDVFAVGVAGAPVVDWHDYDTAYTERYLGLPSTNAAGYDASSLLTYAPRLERPLLIIHGTRDDNVYFFHSLKLCEALFRANKPFDLLPLPGLTHMVPDPAVKEALYTRIMSKLGATLHP